ncbi:hypothetical protein GCM10023224_46280 [Streptomonospora halophila]|uniref:Uncharacterized protein n=1 Tax=Streptomonospora halophila TaxID=427369 RepID=A0ABP9GX85_9ACTN
MLLRRRASAARLPQTVVDMLDTSRTTLLSVRDPEVEPGPRRTHRLLQCRRRQGEAARAPGGYDHRPQRPGGGGARHVADRAAVDAAQAVLPRGAATGTGAALARPGKEPGPVPRRLTADGRERGGAGAPAG